jgi:hypothetical protein
MATMNAFGRLTVTELQARKIIGHSILKATNTRVSKELVDEVIFNINARKSSELLWTGAKISRCIGGYMVYGYAYDYSDVKPIMQWLNARR